MKRIYCFLSILLATQIILNNKIWAGNIEEITKTFENITSIRIATVSGNLILAKSEDANVYLHLEWDYEPMQNFEYRYEISDGRLELEESFSGSASGHSYWNLNIPDNGFAKQWQVIGHRPAHIAIGDDP